MNKKIKIIIFFLLIIFYGQNSYAEKTVTGSKELPIEINLLLDYYQSHSPDEFKKILPVVMEIDLYARSISKEDIFIIGKTEVYKTLLKNYDAPIKQPVDGTTLAVLRQGITKTQDPFLKWFLQALLKDSRDLIENRLYKEFLLQKNNNIKLEKIEYRKLEKKGELLQYWVSKINPDAQDFPENLKAELNPKMLDALKNIQNSFKLLARESNLLPIAPALKNESELKFFAIKESTTAPAKPTVDAAEQKSVDDILAPITNPPSSADLPSPSQENWIEDENTPPELQNLPKPNNDADWLEDF